MQFRTKSSQLDVILHNGNLIKESRTIECPFSDHSFISAKLGIQAVTKETKTIFGRNLSFNNIQLIIAEIVKLDFDQFNMFGSFDLQWAAFKTKVHLILDNISPIKEIKLKKNDMFPWFDEELLYVKYCRDSAYKSYVKDKSNGPKFALFFYWKKEFTKQYESKIINYFQSKTMFDFKNSKKFWEFYATQIKIKSDKTQKSNNPSELNFNEQKAETSQEMSDLFNLFFTSIKSDSNIDYQDSENFCEEFFNKLSSNGIVKNNKFKFEPISEFEIVEQIFKLPDSGGA
ncbi:hypothetical protein BpHYR1_045648, partial [Brachionus plicatilis]